MFVSRSMTRKVITVNPDTTIFEAQELMAANRIRHLPVVVADNKLVGIVTDRDLVVHGIARGLPLDGRVDAAMTLDVVSVDASTDVRDVVRLFGRHSFRRLPVTSHGRVAGMVSLDDLIVAFAEEFAEITRGVAGQLMFPKAGDPAEPPP